MEIRSLSYADDFVFFTDSSVQMHTDLADLDEYCLINCLTVNTDQSKLMDLKKGGRNREYNFQCQGGQISWVSRFTYLEVLFSSSANCAVQKGIAHTAVCSP
uniref:Interphotoreceptor matrix proteoglycan 1 n=1 Tax=Lygus hesperus TaxID=30085 RepID=A0A0A9XAE3_LYGHE